MHETGVVLDQLAVQAARAIKRFNNGHAISQVEVNALRVFTHEYASLRGHECLDFAVIAASMEDELRAKTTEAESESVRQIKMFLGVHRTEAETTD